MKMYVGGEWIDKRQTIPVVNPYDGSVVDTIPRADADDVERALATAVRGAAVMRRLTGYERFQMLRKAADLLLARGEEFRGVGGRVRRGRGLWRLRGRARQKHRHAASYGEGEPEFSKRVRVHDPSFSLW